MNRNALCDAAAGDVVVTGVVCGTIRSEWGETIRIRNRPHTQIHACLSGERSYFVDGKPLLSIRAGDVLVMPAHTSYDTRAESETGAEGLNVLFYLRDAAMREIVLDSVPFIVRDEDGAYRRDLQAIYDDYLKGGYALLRAKGTLLALLCRLFTQHAMEAAAGCADSIAPALWQIENNLTDRLDMDALAAMCYMSRSTFFRRFKSEVGLSPAAYHMRLRLGKSRDLLSSGLYTVEQVAAVMGFYDAAHFCRLFKRETGEQPSRFRPA